MSWHIPGTAEEYARGSAKGMSWWLTHEPMLGGLATYHGRLIGGILTPCPSEAVRCLTNGGRVELVDAPRARRAGAKGEDAMAEKLQTITLRDGPADGRWFVAMAEQEDIHVLCNGELLLYNRLPDEDYAMFICVLGNY